MGGGFVSSGFESDLFLWVLVWGWREWYIWVGGWPSSFYGSGRVDPELFLYSLSSFFRRVSVCLRFALLTMAAMALCHKAGISSSSG